MCKSEVSSNSPQLRYWHFGSSGHACGWPNGLELEWKGIKGSAGDHAPLGRVKADIDEDSQLASGEGKLRFQKDQAGGHVEARPVGFQGKREPCSRRDQGIYKLDRDA